MSALIVDAAVVASPKKRNQSMKGLWQWRANGRNEF